MAAWSQQYSWASEARAASAERNRSTRSRRAASPITSRPCSSHKKVDFLLKIFSNTWKTKGSHKRTLTGRKGRPDRKSHTPNGGRQARGNKLLSPFYLSQQQGNAALGGGKNLLSLKALLAHMSSEFILPRVVQHEPRITNIVARRPLQRPLRRTLGN